MASLACKKLSIAGPAEASQGQHMYMQLCMLRQQGKGERGSPTGSRDGSRIHRGLACVFTSFSHMKKTGVTYSAYATALQSIAAFKQGPACGELMLTPSRPSNACTVMPLPAANRPGECVPRNLMGWRLLQLSLRNAAFLDNVKAKDHSCT